jgi:tetratricopeptide (TPR) repeat protein
VAATKALVTKLVAENDQGRAVELVREAARQLQNEKLEDAAVELHRDLAIQLLTRGNAGWAADEYYRAAAVFLAQGRIDMATQLLKEAHERLENRDEYQTKKIRRHIGILDATEQPTSRLARLRADFARENQYDFVECCAMGEHQLQG